MTELLQVDPKSSVWSLLALSDNDLERVDLVVLNLAVARGIESLKDLDVQKYIDVVDDWTNQFSEFLVGSEARNFNRAPERWHNDIHFFRSGMLAGFLGAKIGLSYDENERDSRTVRYKKPSDLFVNSLIETKRGNCSSLAQIHVAIARRMGWPTAICSAGYHWLSRFDNGQVSHTIETSKIDNSGAFLAEPDSFYLEKFKLPQKAITCGSELRNLTAREMIGAFVSGRARHYCDLRRLDLADVEYALARHLFPNHRETYKRAVFSSFGSRG